MNSIKLVSFPNKEIVFLIAFLPSGTIHVLDACNHRDSAPLHSMGTLHCTFPNSAARPCVYLPWRAMLFVQFYSSCSMEELCSKGKPENE